MVALLGLVVVYTGSYNVAATEDHVSLMRWALNTIQHTSVDRRADGIKPPQRFTPEMIATGASMYSSEN